MFVHIQTSQAWVEIPRGGFLLLQNKPIFICLEKNIISDVFTTHLLRNYPTPRGEHALYIRGIVNTQGMLGRPRIKLSWAKVLPCGYWGHICGQKLPLENQESR